MEEYQERVLKEKEDLDGKIDRLTSFIHSSNTFRDVGLQEQRLLRKQLRIMEFYSEVLADRISAFGV